MDYSMPGLPVHHQFLESTKTHVHWVGDAIQPSHPLLSQHQGMSQLFASGGQSIGVSASTSFLPMNTQDWSPLGWTGWISLQSKKLSRVFSNTTVQKHQFFSAQLSLPSNSHIHTWLEKTWFWLYGLLLAKWCLHFNIMSRFVIVFLARSKFFFQLHGCSYCLHWFWSPQKWNLTLFPLFPLLFTMKWWDWMPWF